MKKQGIPRRGKKQGIQKKTRKGRTGWGMFIFEAIERERSFFRSLGPLESEAGGRIFPFLSAPKSQRIFLRFAIAMAIAEPRNRSDFRNKRKQHCIAIQGCDGKSLAICDFGVRFPSPNPLLSAGFLAIWVRQRAEIASDRDCAILVR